VDDPDLAAIRRAVERHWGFPSLYPEQELAIRAALAGRDALVVLPTGGGKSLCYQAPAVATGELTVVVSPLIALMKDQVDGLVGRGVPAVRLDSSLPPEETRAARRALARGEIRLLFVSPERATDAEFWKRLEGARPARFAIDEAHCISHWGHDFRPVYRRLAALRELFPAASFHAFTATATERVRADIAGQLALQDPEIVVGHFDRPNLVYRIVPRTRRFEQIRAVVGRHRGEAGIVYTISRRGVEALAARLQAAGFRAAAYHAGMGAEERTAVQNGFAAEALDIVVATVAFGMGVDRSNVRFVLHAAMPKSIEHYQQETGRAGRDGLEAECVLLYSEADFFSWRSLVERSAAEGEAEPEATRASFAQLDQMARFCRGAVCRHRALVEYFGQSAAKESCEACDLCLGEAVEVPEALTVARKILSCVARVGERFGIEHVIQVLRGNASDAVTQRGHERLSTFGILKNVPVPNLRDWTYQLIGQGVLERTAGEYPVLRLTPASQPVLRGERGVRLIQARPERGPDQPRSRVEIAGWEGVDRDLFERLRALRKRLAEERGVPPYVVFHDSVLRDLAREKPASRRELRTVRGVGEAKLASYGEAFLREIASSRPGLP
jgi:ATP-dependent DNA helicase RecQ